MKKTFALTKNRLDVYIFNLLVLLTSLILVWTNVYNKPKGFLVVNVYIASQKIDQLSLDDDSTVVYLQADYPNLLGDVTLEIVNRKVRVEKETSPLHYCSIQGWVSSPGLPIVCAPNYFMAVIDQAETLS